MRLLLLFVFSLAAFAQQDVLDSLRFAEVARGLDEPTAIAHAGDGSGRLFVVERAGRIWVFNRDFERSPQPFLDIRGRVGPFGSEQGLLGLAFHPDYETNGRFFVYYIDRAGGTVVAEYGLSADPNIAAVNSEVVFFTATQPFNNHNGGDIHFGPDGMLYIATGDGGSSDDPRNRAQNLGDPLGKILRVDVDNGAPAKAPPDNPFVGTPGARPEIWAYGLRNPWRFNFDRQTGDMWIADVGQNTWEEVNFAPAGATGGLNYGWRRMEGRHCFIPGTSCNDGSLVLPVAEYRHTGAICSVTGGYRYRGSSYPSLSGVYFYGDFCSGDLFALIESSPGVFQQLGPRSAGFSFSTFGEDEAGEIYFADYNTGAIYRLEGPLASPSISEGGVVNAASFAAGQSVAPGSIVSAFGMSLAGSSAGAERTPLPTTLGGSTFTFGNVDAALFFVSPGQANMQVPWELEGQRGAQLTATSGGVASTPYDVNLAPVAPGVFTMDQSGSGQAAALITGTGLLAAPSSEFANARPARLGEFIEVFVTGLGPVSNTPPTGAVSPSEPLAVTQFEVTARIGGVEPVPVRFAGLAPGFIGLYQVNIQLVGDLPSGSQVELVLFVNGVQSNTVTIAIE